MGRRIKVSLTLDEQIVAALDREAACSERPNRSEVVERALRNWMRGKRRARLNEEIEADHLSLTPQEREEDAAWARLGDDGVSDLWDE